jgi:N-methylhydantoinase A/oxoprolinase/acetone carboxylase beta subunit
VDGRVVDGPAIVEEPTSTTVVPPGWRVALGPANALVITRTEGTDR